MRILAVICLLPIAAIAQRPPAAHHVVAASGEATVAAKPDRAQISLGVETNDPTAEAAARQNAAQSTKLLAALRRVVGTTGSIATSQYSITPVYQDRYKQGEVPALTGYRADNTVVVKTSDLKLVPKILDTAMQAGANHIAGVSFTLHNGAAVRAKALAQAAEQARANAEAIANGLHLHVVRVLRAESSGAELRPVRQFVANKLMASSVPTPIEPATVQVSANVTVTLEVQ